MHHQPVVHRLPIVVANADDGHRLGAVALRMQLSAHVRTIAMAVAYVLSTLFVYLTTAATSNPPKAVSMVTGACVSV